MSFVRVRQFGCTRIFLLFFRGVRFISRMFSRYDLPFILYSVFDGFDFYPVSSPVYFAANPPSERFLVARRGVKWGKTKKIGNTKTICKRDGGADL